MPSIAEQQVTAQVHRPPTAEGVAAAPAQVVQGLAGVENAPGPGGLPAPCLGPPPLDLSDAGTLPWEGAGSGMAVLAYRGDDVWRVKATGDNDCSALEVGMAKLFQLTGLAAPDTALARQTTGLPVAGDHVASRYEEHYVDLGEFLRLRQAEALVAGTGSANAAAFREQRARYDVAVGLAEAVLQRAGVERPWELQRPDLQAEHATHDLARFKALEAMNRLLPAPMRCEQLRHYIASRWLGNWDHLNYRMENFGYTMRDGQPVGMTVDFGSAGPLGFRNPYSGVMLPKQASTDIAVMQRPHALFAAPDVYLENAGEVDVFTSDHLPLHDPTQLPYGYQSETISELLGPRTDLPDGTADTVAEMGYRLALLPREAMAMVLQHYWAASDADNDRKWIEAPAALAQLCARRDALVREIGLDQIRAWIQADPVRAAQAQASMAAAVAQVFTSPGAAAPHLAALQAAHEMLLAPPVPAINGLTRETRSLQSLHACLQRLDHALASSDARAVTAVYEELLSEPIYGQLLANQSVGPGSRSDRTAAFVASGDWLALAAALMGQDRERAQQLLDRLVTPVKDEFLPPLIASNAKHHPAMGEQFVQLLVAMKDSGISPESIRLQLLMAKQKGEPNFFNTLLRAPASASLLSTLRQADLLPSSQEIRDHKSMLSSLVMQIALWRAPLGDAAIDSSAPAAAAAERPDQTEPSAHQAVRCLLQPMLQATSPATVAALEAPMIREAVLPTLQWAARSELKRQDHLVDTAFHKEWAAQARKHPDLLPHKPPVNEMRGAQSEARDALRAQLKEARRDEVEAQIDGHMQRYREHVAGAPAMSLEERQAMMDTIIKDAMKGLQRWVEARAGSDNADALPEDSAEVTVRATVSSIRAAATTAAESAAMAQAQAQAQASSRRAAETRAAETVATRTAERAASGTAKDLAYAAVRDAKVKAMVEHDAEQKRRRQGAAQDHTLHIRWLGHKESRRIDARQEADYQMVSAAPSPPTTSLGSARRAASRTATALDSSGRSRTLQR